LELGQIDEAEKNFCTVLIIGRYNFQKPKHLDELQRDFPRLGIEYLTAHKSKGREADYVIIIGLRSGRLGFPCQIADDPVLSLVMAKEDPHPIAGERLRPCHTASYRNYRSLRSWRCLEVVQGQAP
jgi:DNA helicase-4